FHAHPIYHGTNMLLKLFTNETATAKLLRGLVLRASNNFPPQKKLITKQLTG
ncbi:5-demethoxyubiquinol-8 5-hydroxylase UbiM, partial [Neisseria sp. P0001.S008]